MTRLERIMNRRYAFRAVFLQPDPPGARTKLGRFFLRLAEWAERKTKPSDPTPSAATVLAVLAAFCRANKPTSVYSHVRGQIDPLASARADGRREVWLLINEYLNLDDRTILNLKEPDND